jgi:diguanylate cyclase (GGDEF)-like protein
VLIADLERLRSINETLGRHAGDDLLKQVADRIGRVATNPRWLARLGADHFATVVPAVAGVDSLRQLIEQRTRDILGEPFKLGDVDVHMSWKLGIALYPDDGVDSDTLLRNAEAAVRSAKASGERYAFYAPQMTARGSDAFKLESRLRHALDRNEFVLHYQPKVDGETGRIVGAEALIRWQSPDLGLVPPARFIGLLEETGMIVEAGTWALRQAAMDHRTWVQQGLPAPRVAVNISAMQLRHRDFVPVLRQVILEGVAPTCIDLEITESLVMEDVEASIRKLREACELGLEIAIDDFGTGYSSLGYLAKLPIHALKIDRSFIIMMLKDPDTMTLVSTMISLARSLRLKVVAEGVEDEEQAKVLRLLRCHQMQGYFFGKPVTAEEFSALLC